MYFLYTNKQLILLLTKAGFFTFYRNFHSILFQSKTIHTSLDQRTNCVSSAIKNEKVLLKNRQILAVGLSGRSFSLSIPKRGSSIFALQSAYFSSVSERQRVHSAVHEKSPINQRRRVYSYRYLSKHEIRAPRAGENDFFDIFLFISLLLSLSLSPANISVPLHLYSCKIGFYRKFARARGCNF